MGQERNVIFHEVSKECYIFHKIAGHLIAVDVKTCPAEIRFLLCRDKMIKQHRSQLYPELTKMPGSEKLRPTLPNTSAVGMTKPYNDMYTQNLFTDLEHEYSYFLCTLQSFTDPGCKQNLNTPEKKLGQYSIMVPFH